MSNSQALAVVSPQQALTLNRETIDYCTLMAQADLLPDAYHDKPGNVLMALELGKALGLNPVVAITQIHIIKGKPSASATLMAGLVRSHGHSLYVTGDDTRAQATIVRSDQPNRSYVVEWTLQMAETAKLLSKDNWKWYPGAMLKARAISQVCRDACSDVLCGINYTPEELEQPNLPIRDLSNEDVNWGATPPGAGKTKTYASISTGEAKPAGKAKKKEDPPATAPAENPAPAAAAIPEAEVVEVKPAAAQAHSPRHTIMSLANILWGTNSEVMLKDFLKGASLRTSTPEQCKEWISRLNTMIDDEALEEELPT